MRPCVYFSCCEEEIVPFTFLVFIPSWLYGGIVGNLNTRPQISSIQNSPVGARGRLTFLKSREMHAQEGKRQVLIEVHITCKVNREIRSHSGDKSLT